MGLASNNLLKTIYKGQNPNDKATRMATIIRGDSTNGYIVKFYGEESESQKRYKVISGASAPVGSKVIMTKINGTYIITGRVV